jgi:hypothetical protein
MLRKVLGAVALMLLSTPAWAQEADPTIAMQNDFVVLQVQAGHLATSIAAVLAQVKAERAAHADAESRLKWLLDNPEWLGAPKGKK